jgi:excisionase family DNA binding protein
MWRVSKMTVYRMAHSGELGALRIGRSFRIPRAGVEAFHHPDALQATHYRPRRIETAAARCQRPDPMLTTT